MTEYDIDGDGYADHTITVEYGDSTTTVVDADGDGYADAVVYEPADAGYDESTGYQEPGEESTGYDGYYAETPYGTDSSTSSSYYNDALGTGVSSDGDVGYVNVGDGEFVDFGMG
jgi:hypothetical protein